MQLINGLHFNNLRGDLYGGLTAAVVALPLALAMGVASGAGPVAGLYGAIFVGFFAALLGGTPSQVSGPTGPMMVVMALIFTEYTSMFPNDPATGAALAFSIVVMGGLFQVVFGALRFGKYIELIPHPVVSGLMSGIGVIIILSQLGPLLGYDSSVRPLEAIQELADRVSNPQQAALVLGLLALLILYGVPKFLPKVNQLLPSPLLALLIGTLSYLVFMQESGVAILGEMPAGLPSPVMPLVVVDILPGMIGSALVLAVLGSINTLLTGQLTDAATKTFHKPDRELIGQGVGNMVSGLFGALPGAGASMRTMANIKAGGQTPLAGALHALILLLMVLGAGGLASSVPHAILAAILIKVGIDMMDWEYLGRLRTAPKISVALMFTVLLMTVFVDLVMAVATGMVLASFIFLKRITDLQLESMTITNSSHEDLNLLDEEKRLLADAKQRVVLFNIGGAVSFGAARGMVKRLSNFNNYDVLVLDLTEVPVIDYTATRTLDTIICDAIALGREVMLVGTRSSVSKMLKTQKVLDRVHSDYMFVKRIGALRAALEFVKQR